MRKTKKILAMTLALATTVSTIPYNGLTSITSYATEYEEFNEFVYSVENGKATIENHYKGETTEVIIPNTIEGYPVTAIDERAFMFDDITKITIPDSVTSIGDFAFDCCNGITSITIPDSVTNIKEGAFYGCSGLTDIKIPNSITNIGSRVFEACTGLTSVTIPDSVKSIGDFAFSDCENLTSITIPDSVTSIGDYAFRWCIGLASITIPDSVESIGKFAFYNCDNLTSITIPKSVKSIGKAAFYECENLTIYGEAGSTAESYAKKNNIPFSVLKDTTAVSGVSVKSTKVSLEIGKKSTITAFVHPLNATDKTLKYKSSNPTVATVSSKGVITAIKAGTAKITVSTSNGKTATVTVTVKIPNKIIKNVPSSVTLKKGKTLTLKPTVTKNTTDKITYKSSNSKIATVSSKGKITAKKTGSATITVKCGKIKKKVKVKVVNKNTKLTLSKRTINLKAVK